MDSLATVLRALAAVATAYADDLEEELEELVEDEEDDAVNVEVEFELDELSEPGVCVGCDMLRAFVEGDARED